MTNAEWMIKNGYKFSDLHFSFDNNGDIVISLNDKILVRGLYIPFEDALKRWLDMEHDEKILNDSEKKYLSAVIRPFRDKVLDIVKSSLGNTNMEEYISIHFEKKRIYLFPEI
jgi:hypothetical protein